MNDTSHPDFPLANEHPLFSVMDTFNRANLPSLTIERDRFNRPVVIGELLGGDRFIVTLDNDNKPRYISGFGDTIFEEECSINYKEDERIYTMAALKDVGVWLSDQEIPDFTGQPLVIDNFEYLTEHPIGKNEKSAVLEFTVNGWDSDVVLLTEDYKDVCGEDDANMLVFIDQLDEEDQKRHRALYSQFADACRKYMELKPYSKGMCPPSHFMRYGTKMLGDDSSMIRYNVPVRTWQTPPTDENQKEADAIPARLIVNRKNKLWEACLFVNDDLYSRMSQEATPLNGDFGNKHSHEGFLRHVQMVYGFTGGIEFEFSTDNFEPE